jgi:hypothetical protein
MQALKARDSRAQGEAAKQLKPWVGGRKRTKPSKGDTTGCCAIAVLYTTKLQDSRAAANFPKMCMYFAMVK